MPNPHGKVVIPLAVVRYCVGKIWTGLSTDAAGPGNTTPEVLQVFVGIRGLGPQW